MTHARLEFPYTRTTGPVIGAFLGALRDGRILGSRVGGRVVCPPVEYDPATAAPLAGDADLVEVGPGGTVGPWTWVANPTPKHPFDHPFAFALITLDGADTALLHAVDAGSIDAMSTGMRVRAQLRDEPKGAITDIWFVPDDTGAAPSAPRPAGDVQAVEQTEHLISLDISEPLLPHRERFARGLLDGKIIGQRSPATGMVFVPGRGYDNLGRVLLSEADDVVCSDRGSVSAFTVITPVQYYGQQETEPYIRASILLDGTDQAIIGVDIRDIPVEAFRVGLRVQAVWRPPGERDVSDLDNRWGGIWEHVIARWEPTGEPDADPRSLEKYSF